MSTKPIIIVAGLGRCGSSMTMQMLAAGGMPCAGKFPDFEDGRVRILQWWNNGPDLHGHAIKVLDPHRVGVPLSLNARVIWLGRRHIEQARSIAKMLHQLDCRPRFKTSEITRLQKGLVQDTAIARAAIAPFPTLVLQFEETLAFPARAATAIAKFVGPHFHLDVDAMAAAVRARGPLCAPGLSMELNLLREVQTA